MIKRPLVLFTSSFPFGNNENFLETEIKYLANHFHPVVIVPYMISSNMRAIPKYVEVDVSMAATHPTGPFKHFASGIWLALTSSQFFAEIQANPHIIKKPFFLKRLIGFIAKTERCYNWLQTFLTKRPELKNGIFYTYWFLEQTLALGLLNERDKLNLRIISRAHGCDIYEKDYTPPYIPLREQALSHVDNVFTISESGKAYFQKYPKHSSRIHTSQLGVHDSGFSARPSSREKFSIVSCSHLIPLKRLDLLIKGLAHFARQNPDLSIEWNHFGEGELLDKLKVEASQYLKNISWKFHGFIPNAALLDFYKTHPIDLFASVSETEGIPVSIMEAQSCGIPILATNVGGVSEIVNEENGLLLSAHPTPDDIAQAISSINNNRDIQKQKGLAAKQNWKLNYNAEINYENFCEHLKNL